jgi:hypothetical protein
MLPSDLRNAFINWALMTTGIVPSFALVPLAGGPCFWFC